mmetsp:Transcript_33774/g.44564  ORF Transcript_33774/g.44564 Transcript_33774/m.44564 type:complete len:256 (-) Transcript_33774:445-1212(-)
MCSEDLNEGDLERGDLSMHEDSCQVELHLEADVDIAAIDRGRPPKSEPSIRDLVKTGALRMSQLFVLHGFFEARRFLPEEAFPSGEVGSFEECVLQDALNTAQSLNHIRAVVVQVPKLTVVLLVRPPEGILLQDLILFEVLAHAPALIVGEGEAIFLEERVDARHSAIPRVLQVVQRQSTVLRLRLFPFECVLGPDALAVHVLRLPRLDVTIKVGNQLIFFVGHSDAEVRDSGISLLRHSQVTLRDQNVAHREHS